MRTWNAFKQSILLWLYNQLSIKNNCFTLFRTYSSKKKKKKKQENIIAVWNIPHQITAIFGYSNRSEACKLPMNLNKIRWNVQYDCIHWYIILCKLEAKILWNLIPNQNEWTHRPSDRRVAQTDRRTAKTENLGSTN